MSHRCSPDILASAHHQASTSRTQQHGTDCTAGKKQSWPHPGLARLTFPQEPRTTAQHTAFISLRSSASRIVDQCCQRLQQKCHSLVHMEKASLNLHTHDWTLFFHFRLNTCRLHVSVLMHKVSKVQGSLLSEGTGGVTLRQNPLILLLPATTYSSSSHSRSTVLTGMGPR